MWERAAAVVDVTGLLRRGSLAEAAASRKSGVWRMMVQGGGPGFSRDETSFAVVAFLCFVGRSKSIAFAQWLLYYVLLVVLRRYNLVFLVIRFYEI